MLPHVVVFHNSAALLLQDVWPRSQLSPLPLGSASLDRGRQAVAHPMTWKISAQATVTQANQYNARIQHTKFADKL